MKYLARAVRTRYWRPGSDCREIVVRRVGRHLKDGDIVVVSEKAISVAQNRLVDEDGIRPGVLAKIIARFWMRKVWGYILGPLCRLRRVNLQRMRSYPLEEGSAHKQLTLEYAGLHQSLRNFSEGGIDVSNVPYAYACLPLEDPGETAEEILWAISKVVERRVGVMIVDSDKTYSFGSFHVTPRPKPLRGIICLGLPGYILGRLLKWLPRSTPLAIAGMSLSPEEALRVAAVANRARGHGAGRTVWDMAERFGVGLVEVTWEDLDGIVHSPIVVVRRCS